MADHGFGSFDSEMGNQQRDQKQGGVSRQNASGGNGERGFAAMTNEKQREIARKGGETVSQNREHMAAIGRKGGEAVSQNREHMAAIGRKGGESSHGGGRNNKD